MSANDRHAVWRVRTTCNMAGSRTEKIGSIFYRVTGLLRSGALKEADKPIWYDVYAAFPPKVEPKFDRVLVRKDPPSLLYKEDLVRAQFYKIFQSNHPIDMTDEEIPSLSERFIQKFDAFEKLGTMTHREAFEAAADALRAEGIRLKTQEEIKQEAEKRKEEVARKRKAELEKRSMKLERLTMADVFGDVESSDSEGDIIDETELEIPSSDR